MTTKPNDPIQFVVPVWETSILAGASGAGKTTLLIKILKHLQDNEPVFGYETTPDLTIGYIAADRTWDAYIKLADSVGLDLSRIKVRALIDDDDIDTEAFERDPQIILYGLLKEMARAGVDLVVVDPLVVFLGCATNVYHTNAARLIKLNRFCRQNKITVLGTHHATKARTDYGFKRPQDRISGSAALLGFTSTQLMLIGADETEDKECAEWHIISHHAAPKVVYLKRNQNGLFEEVIQAPEPIDISNFEEVTVPQDINVVLLNLIPLDGTPIQRKDIVSRLSRWSPRTVDSQLKMLSDNGTLRKYSGGYYGAVLG